MANIRIPDNAELAESLESTEKKMEELKIEKGSRLPEASKKAIDDTEKVVRDVRNIIFNKSQGNRLQRFLSYSYRGSYGATEIAKKTKGAAPGTRTALQRAPKDLKKLATLLITSRKFRDFLEESLEVCQTFVWNVLHVNDVDYQPRKVRLDLLVQKELENKEAASTIRGLFRLLSAFFEEVIDQNKGLTKDPEVETWRQDTYKAAEEAKALIEEFTQGISLDPVFDNMRRLFTEIQNDSNIRNFFYELREYLEKPLKQPDIVNDQYYEKGEFIINYGITYFQKDQFKDLTNTVVKQLKEVFTAIKEDPELLQLLDDLKRLNDDFYVTDASGNKKFNVDLFLQHLRKVVIPVVIKVLNHIKMPKIENHDESYDYVIDNIVFAAEDILPENIRVEDTSVIELSNVSNEIQGENPVNRIKVDVKKINFNVHEADVWFHRKSTPTITDSGKMDIEVDKAGTDINIILNAEHAISSIISRLSGKKEAEIKPLYDVELVKCTVHNLHVNFKDTKHDTLYNFFMRLFPGMIKSRVQSVIENNIRSVLEDFRYRARSDFYQIPDFSSFSVSSSESCFREKQQPQEQTLRPTIGKVPVESEQCQIEQTMSTTTKTSTLGSEGRVFPTTTAGEQTTKM